MNSNTGKPQESKPQERPRNTSKPQESKPQERPSNTGKPQERPSNDSGPNNNGNRKDNELWSREYHYRWVLSAGPVAFTLSSLKSYLVFLFLFFSNLFYVSNCVLMFIVVVG